MKFLVKRFVAGKTAAEALKAIQDLNRRGIKVTLDYLGEECRSKEQAEEAVKEYEALLRLLSQARADANASLKLTQLGLNLDRDLAKENLIRVLDVAKECGNFIRIDMEGSVYAQMTLDLFHEIFPAHKNVGVVIQAYLRRSEADIERLNQVGARVRLCKGAYKEPAAVAFQDKQEINRNYDKLAKALITRGNYPGIATHDDERIAAAMRAAQVAKISPEKYEFQMLYGVRPKRWQELAQGGYNIRVYMPYGSHWFPYYYRRIRERKENLIFAARSVLGI